MPVSSLRPVRPLLIVLLAGAALLAITLLLRLPSKDLSGDDVATTSPDGNPDSPELVGTAPPQVSSPAADDEDPAAAASAVPTQPAAVPAQVVLRPAPDLAPAEKQFRQRLQPRKPFPKMPVSRPPGEELQVVVKLRDEHRARPLDDGRLTLIAEEVPEGLDETIRELGVRFRSYFNGNSAPIERLVARAEQSSQNAQADLEGTLIAVGSDPSPDGAQELATRLNNLSSVEYAYLESLDQRPPPPEDITPVTSSFVSAQNYRGGNPGIGVDLAWGEYGARGTDVRFGDTEWACNVMHEDLRNSTTDLRITDLSPPGTLCTVYQGQTIMDSQSNHGVAVFGVVMSGDNGYGTTGIAPDTDENYFASEFMPGGRPSAIAALAAEMRVGDVVLLEQQTSGGFPNEEFAFFGGYGPADLDPTVWNTVKAATDCGVVVVITAGNGDADLDRPAFAPYRDRGDNGAIINGAGKSDTSHLKKSFSSHGTPVHLQGWGENVATTGYGSLANVDGYINSDLTDCLVGNQLYTRGFSGTSSAGPIVAGACVAVQSVAKAELKRPLTPREMRELLIDTGTPQTLGGGTGSGIGTYEAESVFSRSSSEDPVVTMTGDGASGDYLLLDNSNSYGFIEFTIPNINPGSYAIKIRQVLGPDLGIYRLSYVDGNTIRNLGQTVDQYQASKSAQTTIAIGTASWETAGPKRIRLDIDGKNPSSTGARLTVDQIIIEDASARGKVGPLVNIPAAIRELLGTPGPVALDGAGAYTQAFATTGDLTPESGWTLLDGAESGRTRLLDGALRMDSAVSGRISTNAATLHLNLAGRSNVVLSYDIRESADETHLLTTGAHTGIRSGDGICISADGETWHGVSQWDTTTPGWTRKQLDLDAAIAAAGLSYSGDFRIRFQHTDDFSWPTDGIEIDNIVVHTSPAAQLELSITNLGLSTVVGVNPDPVTFSILNRGNSSAPFSFTESIPWATVSPASGTVPAGGSVDVTATFDTSALAASVYGGAINTSFGGIWINLVVHATSVASTYRQYDTLPVASIPSFGPASRYPIPLEVRNMEGRITNLNVALWGVTHTRPDDLNVLLVSPDGREVMVMADAGGGTGLTSANLFFNDSAGTAVPDSTALVSGSTYRPANYAPSNDTFPGRPVRDSYPDALSAFNGADSNGIWSLYVYDDLGGYEGSISGFTLYLTTDTGLGGLAEQFVGGADSFDLDGQSLLFTPDGSDPGYATATTAIGSLPTVHTSAAKTLELGSNDSAAFFLQDELFPFYGGEYGIIHVASDGYVALAAPQSNLVTTLDALHAQPLIACFGANHDPTTAGSVMAENFADRAVVTWSGVSWAGSAATSSFQLELYHDGRIRMSWDGVAADSGIVTGLSAGYQNSNNLPETDFFILPRGPYTVDGLPAPIPGIVQAEDYDQGEVLPLAWADSDSINEGGVYRPYDGVDIYPTSDTGGGYSLRDLANGEWTEYTVEVATAGTYTIHARVGASLTGGTFRLEFDGVDKTGPVTCNATGGSDLFGTHVITGVALEAGVQVMRLHWILGAGSSINHLTFIGEGAGNEPGLAARWMLDEVSGVGVSDAATNNDGTIHGTISWEPGVGVFDGALALSGSDNWVEVPSDEILQLRSLNQRYTVSGWIRPHSSADQLILYSGLGCGTWGNWYLGIGSGDIGATPSAPGRLIFGVRAVNQYSSTAVIDPAPVELDTWTHVAATWDGDLLRLYINGTLADEITGVPAPFESTIANLAIGADPGCLTTGRSHFDGFLDDLRIYVRDLPGTEIQAQANAGLSSFEDRDGDGQSNGDEIAFGTNPFLSSSVFRPTVTRNASGQPVVSFPGVSGISYSIQYSTSLTGWTTIATRTPENDGQIDVSDTDPIRNAAPAGYYRVAVEW